MWLQLRYTASLFLIFLVGLRPFVSLAQSVYKYKKLNYTERAPGIVVDQDSLEVLLELEDQSTVNMLVIHDVVTGASPTGVRDALTNTGASTIGRGQGFANFSDERWAYSLGVSPLITRTAKVSTTLLYSKENDYLSKGISLGFSLELNKKNTTIAPTATFLDDVVTPSNGKPEREKKVNDYTLSLSQVVNRWNLVTMGINKGYSRGYLTDPYKKVQIGTVVVDEIRPELRIKNAVALSWRTKPLKFHAFDLKYRYYWDDWGLRSQTTRLATFHELGESWLFELFWRHYRQSAVDWWDDLYPAGYSGQYRSSDTRLAWFDAVTAGATAIYKIDDKWWLEGSFSSYSQYARGCGFLGVEGMGADESIRMQPLLLNGDDDGGSDEHGEGGEGLTLCGIDTRGAYLTATITSLGIQYRY